MAWDDDGDRISSVGRSDCSHRFWTPDLSCDVPIAASLAERDGRERSPHLLLKFGSSEIEIQGKSLEFTREVMVQLAFRLEQHRMIFVFHQRCEPDSFRIVVLPKDRGQSSLRRDFFRRRHLHRSLLPADLSSENTAAEKLPFLRKRVRRGESIVPSVPAVPAGTGTGPGADR